jgi:hypothetical protein
MNHWLAKIGDDTRSLIVKTIETGIAAYVWNATKPQREKLATFFRKSKKQMPAIQGYSLAAVQLPTPDVRSASAGVSFSFSVPMDIWSAEHVTSFKFEQTK